MARIKTNEDIPAPPRGSRSKRAPQYTPLHKVPKNLLTDKEHARLKAREPRTVLYKRSEGVKSPGRAQPKGTQPKGMASPPRTGPSSGGGGQSARYNRLTGGGLNKHGR